MWKKDKLVNEYLKVLCAEQIKELNNSKEDEHCATHPQTSCPAETTPAMHGATPSRPAVTTPAMHGATPSRTSRRARVRGLLDLVPIESRSDRIVVFINLRSTETKAYLRHLQVAILKSKIFFMVTII